MNKFACEYKANGITNDDSTKLSGVSVQVDALDTSNVQALALTASLTQSARVTRQIVFQDKIQQKSAWVFSNFEEETRYRTL